MANSDNKEFQFAFGDDLGLNAHSFEDMIRFDQDNQNQHIPSKKFMALDIQDDQCSSSNQPSEYRQIRYWPFKTYGDIAEDFSSGKPWFQIAIEEANADKAGPSCSTVENLPIHKWLTTENAQEYILRSMGTGKSAVEREDYRDFRQLLKEIEMKTDVQNLFLAEMRQMEKHRAKKEYQRQEEELKELERVLDEREKEIYEQEREKNNKVILNPSNGETSLFSAIQKMNRK